MGYKFSKEEMASIFSKLAVDYDVFAPVVKKGDGTFSDVDVVRYDKVSSLDEIEFEKKSDYSFKEAFCQSMRLFFILQRTKQQFQRDLQRSDWYSYVHVI